MTVKNKNNKNNNNNNSDTPTTHHPGIYLDHAQYSAIYAKGLRYPPTPDMDKLISLEAARPHAILDRDFEHAVLQGVGRCIVLPSHVYGRLMWDVTYTADPCDCLHLPVYDADDPDGNIMGVTHLTGWRKNK